jgi:hypothetical protein
MAIAELLAARGHDSAVEKTLSPKARVASFDPLLLAHLARALYGLGRTEEADALVATQDSIHSEYGRWMANHARFLATHDRAAEAARASQIAVELDPLEPEVACQEKMPPELPDTEVMAALCRAARSR